MKAPIFAVCLLSSTVWSQALTSVPWTPDHTSEPPAVQPAPPQVSSYANYSIMLVNPTGGAVVLMHTPKNELEYVDVKKTQEAFAAGYVPMRTAEVSEMITTLSEEVVRLRGENARLRQIQARIDTQPRTYVPQPAPVDVAAQQRAQAAADQFARRQQLIQAWLTLQNRSQTLNLNVTNCNTAPCIR